MDFPIGHTVPALHAPRTQGPPGCVVGAQTPHTASGARAQNVLAHCQSSPHATPAIEPPAWGAQAAPKSPLTKAAQGCVASESAQLRILAGVALVPGAPNLGRQSSARRCSQTVRLPNKSAVANGVQVSDLAHRALARAEHACSTAGSATGVPPVPLPPEVPLAAPLPPGNPPVAPPAPPNPTPAPPEPGEEVFPPDPPLPLLPPVPSLVCAPPPVHPAITTAEEAVNSQRFMLSGHPSTLAPKYHSIDPWSTRIVARLVGKRWFPLDGGVASATGGGAERQSG